MEWNLAIPHRAEVVGHLWGSSIFSNGICMLFYVIYIDIYIYIIIYIAKKKHETVGFEQETRGFEQQVEETAMIHQCNEGTYLYSWS